MFLATMGRKYLQGMVMQKAVTLERIPSLGAQRSRWVAVREDGLDGGSRDCPPYHINLNTQRQDSKSLLGTNQCVHFYILKYVTARSLHRYKTAAAAPDFQFSSIAQLCPTLQPHEPQHPGLPVHHQLPEFTQTHVH